MDQVPDLVPRYDWALNEECLQFDECDPLLPFIAAGEPVFDVEYALELWECCDRAGELRFVYLKKPGSGRASSGVLTIWQLRPV